MKKWLTQIGAIKFAMEACWIRIHEINIGNIHNREMYVAAGLANLYLIYFNYTTWHFINYYPFACIDSFYVNETNQFRLVHSEFFDAVISLVFPVLCVLFISYTFGFSHLIDVKKMLDFSMVFDFGLWSPVSHWDEELAIT